MGLAFASFMLLATSPLLAQRELKNIPPPDPELERKALVVAPGFEVNLFASDPAIAKPIQMNFDPAGRLWLVSSSVYPHVKPRQKADDKVLVLEDRDGDGRADKTTVFAGGLLIPTGIEPGDGGCYVANSTDLLHLADTDGDGRADRRRIVLSGFGTEDTHHLLHTLRWGADGCLYMNQSIYIHSHVETPYGVMRLNGGGIWRFRPETMRLEVVARGWINPWGHDFDDYGQSFVTDGAGGEGINYVVPGASYPTAVGAARILHGLNPGSPKYCGLEVVGGRHLPDDWQGNLLTADFRAHRVCRFVISEDGSGFAARQMDDLIKTTHVGFRPVDIKMGPDGAIYIADWYSPIIQHGEVDFRDPRRDHTHGRIWRVTFQGRKLVSRPKLVGAGVAELLDHLQAPEPWTRRQARRALKERGAAEVLPTLAGWVESLAPDDPLYDRHRLEALWVSQSLRRVQPELLESLLRAGDPRVRASATRVLGDWIDSASSSTSPAERISSDHALKLLEQLIADEHPRVRLEAVRVFARIPQRRAAEIALRALDRPIDEFLDYALWLTCRELQSHWLPDVQAGRLDFDERGERLIFALKSVASPAIVPPLLRLLRTAKLAEDQTAEVLGLIASYGGPRELRLVFDAALDKEAGTARRAELLSSLAEAARRRGVHPAGRLEELAGVLESDSERLRRAALACAGVWKLESLRGTIERTAADENEPLNLRRTALESLAALGGPDSVASLSEVARQAPSAEVRLAAAAALARLTPEQGAGTAAAILADLPPDADPAGLIGVFLQHKRGPELLARSLKGRKIPADVAKLALRTVGAAGREEPQLSEVLRTAGGIAEVGREVQLEAEEMQRLIAEVVERGDPARGEAVFRRRELDCFNCHAIGGAGGQVGPDLSSIGGGSQIDYLIDSLLAPNKAVKENYHTLIVVTDDGRVHTGVRVRQSEEELVLRDAEDREITIPTASISLQKHGKSLMPPGLTEKLTRGELVDLVRFLAELGKVGRFSVGTETLARRWRVLRDTPEARRRLQRTSYQAAASDDPAFSWEPAYSSVSGELPLEALPEIRVRNRVAAGARGVAFARCVLEVTTPGEFRWRLNSPAGLSLWVDGAPVPVKPETRVRLSAGRHRLVFGVDLARRERGLRVELIEDAASAGKGRFLTGK